MTCDSTCGERRRRSPHTWILAAFVVIAGACGGVDAHADGAGTLSALRTDERVTMWAEPDVGPIVTFGSIFLCTEDDQPVELVEIEPGEVVGSVAIAAFGAHITDGNAVGVWPGFPPVLAEEAGPVPYDDVEGFEIAFPCAERSSTPDQPEVVIALERADAAGGRVEDLLVHYRRGSEPLTLRIQYSLLMCGTEQECDG